MGFKAELKRLRERAQLKVTRSPLYAQGYLKALDDIDDLYSDLTHNYARR
jgi:hypothetical protein